MVRTPVCSWPQLSATDISARAPMKGAAKRDSLCELQNSVNQWPPERALHSWDFLRVCLLQCLVWSTLFGSCLWEDAPIESLTWHKLSMTSKLIGKKLLTFTSSLIMTQVMMVWICLNDRKHSTIWKSFSFAAMMGYWRCGGHTCWDFQNGWCPRGRRCRWSHQVGILDSSCRILKHSVVQFRSRPFEPSGLWPNSARCMFILLDFAQDYIHPSKKPRMNGNWMWSEKLSI